METKDGSRSGYGSHGVKSAQVGKVGRPRPRILRKMALAAVVFALVGSGALSGQEAWANEPNHRKCAQLKQLEAGKAYACRLKALSIATKREVEPDYSRCDTKLRRKYERLEATVCASPRPSLPSMHRFLSTATRLVEIATEFDENGEPNWKDIPPLSTKFVDQCGRSCTGPAGGPYECTRVRKEVSDLTTNELQRLITALRQAPSDPELMELLEKLSEAFTQRGGDGVYLPWHRAYILEVENLLRRQDCRITIPYWDWTKLPENFGRPHLSSWIHFGDESTDFSGDGNGQDFCVESGPFGTSSGYSLPGGRCLKRNFRGFSGASSEQIQSHLFDQYPQPSQYDSFRHRLEHGPGFASSIHCSIGGTMCSSEASHDPLFFVLLAQVDRLWAQWQSQSPAHLKAYQSVAVEVDEVMPFAEWTPGEMLDLNDQPGGVRVRYE